MTTERYRRVRRLAWLMGMVCFARLLRAQTLVPASYPISEETITDVLQASGVKVHPSAVHLPGLLRSSTQSPSLEIASVERLGSDRTRVELRCRHIGECIPFFVTLDLGASNAALPLSLLQSTSSNREAGPGIGSGSLPLERTAARGGDPSARMQAGSRVTIVLADPRMLIQLPGIAMDAGAPGTDVRICTPDRKTIFHARVVDSTIAKGTIQ